MAALPHFAPRPRGGRAAGGGGVPGGGGAGGGPDPPVPAARRARQAAQGPRLGPGAPSHRVPAKTVLYFYGRTTHWEGMVNIFRLSGPTSLVLNPDRPTDTHPSLNFHLSSNVDPGPQTSPQFFPPPPRLDFLALNDSQRVPHKIHKNS